jgi:hypothetical protein
LADRHSAADHHFNRTLHASLSARTPIKSIGVRLNVLFCCGVFFRKTGFHLSGMRFETAGACKS